MTFNNDKAIEEIRNKIIAEHKLIKVKSGKLRWNFYCHRNSVHDAIKKGDKKIAMCIYIDNGCPIIHFINYHKKKFVENTLGTWNTQYEYYFIKWIKQDEFHNVDNIFEAYREELGKSLSWWVRATSDWRG